MPFLLFSLNSISFLGLHLVSNLENCLANSVVSYLLGKNGFGVITTLNLPFCLGGIWGGLRHIVTSWQQGWLVGGDLVHGPLPAHLASLSGSWLCLPRKASSAFDDHTPNALPPSCPILRSLPTNWPLHYLWGSGNLGATTCPPGCEGLGEVHPPLGLSGWTTFSDTVVPGCCLFLILT